MTLKFKSISNELRKGWKLAWYHNFTHIACAKSREGYRKNWMHFVYKIDNLFRSIRVSDENSSVTKWFHFLNNLSITKLNIMIKHTNIKHKKKESLKNLFSKLSYSQTSDSQISNNSKFKLFKFENYRH